MIILLVLSALLILAGVSWKYMYEWNKEVINVCVFLFGGVALLVWLIILTINPFIVKSNMKQYSAVKTTIAEMRKGTVALGSVETGMISAASAQMAHFYDIPCRSVAGATEAKTLDLQCGVERQRSLMMAALGGANYITSVGTIESTTAGAHELAVVDNEIIGMVERAIRGIDVNETTLALDVIRRVGPDGNYLMDEHTQMNFRKEHFLPKIADLDTREAWEKAGKKEMIEKAREEARKLIGAHHPRELDPGLVLEMDRFVETVTKRTVADFEAAEWEE